MGGPGVAGFDNACSFLVDLSCKLQLAADQMKLEGGKKEGVTEVFRQSVQSPKEEKKLVKELKAKLEIVKQALDTAEKLDRLPVLKKGLQEKLDEAHFVDYKQAIKVLKERINEIGLGELKGKEGELEEVKGRIGEGVETLVTKMKVVKKHGEPEEFAKRMDAAVKFIRGGKSAIGEEKPSAKLGERYGAEEVDKNLHAERKFFKKKSGE